MLLQQQRASCTRLQRPVAAAAAFRIKEHHGKPIYCVAFNTYDQSNQDLVASVGGYQVTADGHIRLAAAASPPGAPI
jgi:hypothetical protein